VTGVPYKRHTTVFVSRRIRRAVLEGAVAGGASANRTKVVLAGMGNVYTHYVTTFEEYQHQVR
jgi:hypothetical protein